MRPQCGAYSMTEIGNRKKRKAFLYEFPGSAAQRNHRDPVLKREAHKNKNQGAKRPLIPLTPLKTAAKRRWESEDEIPPAGFRDWSHAPAVRDSA